MNRSDPRLCVKKHSRGSLPFSFPKKKKEAKRKEIKKTAIIQAFIELAKKKKEAKRKEIKKTATIQAFIELVKKKEAKRKDI